MTTPGLGDQSSIVPIVIFPICKIPLPGLSCNGRETGNAGGQTKIAPVAVAVGARPGKPLVKTGGPGGPMRRVTPGQVQPDKNVKPVDSATSMQY